MKLLFLTSDKYPPFRVDVSVLFAKELVSRGFQIDWIMQAADKCKNPYISNMNNSLVYVGETDNGGSKLSRLKKHYFDLKNDLIFIRLLKRDVYDFVQVKDKFLTAVLVAIIAKYRKVKFTYWLSYPFPEASIYQAKNKTARYPMFYLLRGIFFKLILYRVIMPLADHVFVQSEKMKNDVVLNNIDPKKLTAVPMGVELESIPFKQDTKIKDKDEYKIVYLGTLARVRRIDFLVRVLSIVKGKFENVKLYLVGGGEDTKDTEVIISEAKKLNLELDICITGYLTRDKAYDHVRTADVCVSPFYPTPILNSTSPTKLVEYLAMGKPVVANDHPEQKLVIEESGCGVCVPYTEQEFADAVIEIIGDLGHWRKEAKKGRAYVAEHRSYEKIANLVSEKYKAVLLDEN